MKSQAARSAKVLLFAYAETFFAFTFVHDSESTLIDLSAFPNIETIDEVKTTLLIPALFAAFKALIVPSTAGLMYSFSSFGSIFINGEATCITKSHPFTASSQPSSLNRFSSQNSRLSFGLTSFLIELITCSVFERFLTEPLTEYPFFNNSTAQ